MICFSSKWGPPECTGIGEASCSLLLIASLGCSSFSDTPNIELSQFMGYSQIIEKLTIENDWNPCFFGVPPHFQTQKYFLTSPTVGPSQDGSDPCANVPATVLANRVATLLWFLGFQRSSAEFTWPLWVEQASSGFFFDCRLWKDPPFLMGKLTISMAIINSYVAVYQRVTGFTGCTLW